jgi:hypothetical protein
MRKKKNMEIKDFFTFIFVELWIVIPIPHTWMKGECSLLGEKWQ